MGRDSSGKKRRAKPVHPPWWTRPWLHCQVYHSQWNTFLVYTPELGEHVLLICVPRSWGFREPQDFLDAGVWDGKVKMKKPDKPKDGPKAWAAPIDDILIPLPYLAEFLAATHYEGQPPGSRVTGSLLVFAQDDYWKVRIQDKEEGRCSWLTISSLLELLEASNDRLGAADPGWKPDRAAPRQEGKDKKGQK